MAKLDKAISKIFFECLKITRGDSCLILIDQFTRKLGHLLFERAKRSKADVALLEITPLSVRSPEPPPSVVNMMKQMSAILAFTSYSLFHSNALKHVCHNGSRVLCLFPLSEECLARSVNTNYEYVDKKSRRLADLFSIGRRIHLTTNGGTDIVIPIARHKGMANTGIVSQPGILCVLPSGEASVTPDRHGTRGVVIVDGSIPSIGILKNPIVTKIKEGYAYQITGGEEVIVLRKMLKSFGKQSRNIAEFGIGTNPNAVLGGTSIEDEKVLGTAHIALGNPEFEGGIQRGKIHLDLILRKPTVEIDGRLIVKDGNLLV
ncbi:MAG: aminopeptidase [bacterium]|nr:MAG: aminopeptidase [bacterium]